jgi:hypothetical protein
VERNKEGDGFVRFRWGEIKKQEADGGGARVMIETALNSGSPALLMTRRRRMYIPSP